MRNKSFSAPLLISLAIVILDQITKAIVVHFIPEGSIAARFFGDFIWIVHARNTGAAFSLGASASAIVRFVVFVVLPLVVLIALLLFYVRTKELAPILRYSIALILGGGTGNLIDRLVRPAGVVDFISVNMYGLLGMDRFATFNVADSAITIGEILLIIGLLMVELQHSQAQSKRS